MTWKMPGPGGWVLIALMAAGVVAAGFVLGWGSIWPGLAGGLLGLGFVVWAQRRERGGSQSDGTAYGADD